MTSQTSVADRWYDVRTIANDISLIRERHVANWLRCNIWHVRGRDRDLIIDTGMGVSPLKTEITALTERPIICISTHAHFDHIGGAHEFDCRLGHASEAHIHAAPDQHNTADWGPFVRAETFTALPRQDFHFSEYGVTPAPLTGFLDEGDAIDLGDRVLQVLHLPGHSPGSIALLETATATLFSGDTVYDGALYDNVYHSDRARYRDSLTRLRDLPVDTIHGGHDQSFGRERMIEIIDDYLEHGSNTIQDAADWVSRQVDSG